MSKRLAKYMDANRKDTEERVKCLRLQVQAWRQLALIAIADPVWGREKAKWLFFKTTPFTDGPAVEIFIADTAKLAEESGIKTGVFGSRAA